MNEFFRERKRVRYRDISKNQFAVNLLQFKKTDGALFPKFVSPYMQLALNSVFPFSISRKSLLDRNSSTKEVVNIEEFFLSPLGAYEITSRCGSFITRPNLHYKKLNHQKNTFPRKAFVLTFF